MRCSKFPSLLPCTSICTNTHFSWPSRVNTFTNLSTYLGEKSSGLAGKSCSSSLSKNSKGRLKSNNSSASVIKKRKKSSKISSNIAFQSESSRFMGVNINKITPKTISSSYLDGTKRLANLENNSGNCGKKE
ncbi:MAG: hypothetical protein EAZ14_08295 [Runella slithyformis]|nr:MAG: hypothetical protein EAZ14_08295 [Runella slithyformis]